ncbi:MAG TPA: phosphate ABC transporter permease PstA [Candidatus Hydrogenedentes bacterium]|nr:phosphate ABC transporter permease PstA [Candidatus Hydrogenedentota bacterium]HOL76077.1 phosphate ABC transporter permease PstA [Candidatus Hydrogenedentota bacterium]HPO84691.1 phosphate ABC transporter permease PstA [Candidatus Hydrogenedentota bacterium]
MRIPPRVAQTVARVVLGAATFFTVAVLIFIIGHVLVKGIPVLSFRFLFSNPEDMGRAGGIFPTLVGSVLLPAVALVFAVPLGIGTAVFLTEYTRESKITAAIRFGADCLAGIPSIIFGLFGFIFFVTVLRMGWCILSGGLTLAMMVLPTIIRTTEEAIRAVPYAYREVSFSLGATRWRTVWRVVLPNALPGIVTGIILSLGRSIGETAAVIFTAGSSLRMPSSLFDSVRTMSVHFYILAREGISSENAYGTAAVLVLAVLMVNGISYWLMHQFMKRFS